MNFPLKITICFILLSAVKPVNLEVKSEIEPPESNYYSTLPGCYNKFVGSKGSVQSPVFPNTYLYSIVCEWDIDVTRGFVVEFEFEAFRLPIDKEQSCDSYVEISYSRPQDEVVKRLFCPADVVDRLYTGSETAHVQFKSGTYHEEYANNTYGFKINYRAVPVSKTSGNNAVTIVLLSFTAVFIVALIICCIRSRHKANKNSDIPNNVVISSQQPNAPTRADLQTAFEFQRNLMQAPHIEQKYLSRTSSVNTNVASRKSFPNRTAPAMVPHLQENRRISIASTPHLVLPESQRKWSSDSIRRIQHLRTKLIARFSSHSSSDISVFFEASDRRSYSQLLCEDDNSPEEPPREDKSVPKPDLISRGIPSIVIELVD